MKNIFFSWVLPAIFLAVLSPFLLVFTAFLFAASLTEPPTKAGRDGVQVAISDLIPPRFHESEADEVHDVTPGDWVKVAALGSKWWRRWLFKIKIFWWGHVSSKLNLKK